MKFLNKEYHKAKYNQPRTPLRPGRKELGR